MRIWRVVALVALASGPAYAQMPNLNLMPEIRSKTPEEKAAEEARDKAYKESLRKIPDAKGASDPWGSVRSPDTAKTSSKPRTKTGSSAN